MQAPSLGLEPLACKQRRRLIELYSIQSREYSEAVAILGLVRDGIEIYHRALEEVESRRIACEQICIELREHIAQFRFLVPRE